MDKINYFEAMDAVKRKIIQKKNKLKNCVSTPTYKKYEGEILLYETILFYMEQCQKKFIKMD